MAGVLFVLPGFVSILALSMLYATYQQSSLVQALFFGLKPAVLAIVVEAVIRIGRRVLKSRELVAIAVAAFVAIFCFDLPFPLLVVAAGILGLVGGRLWPGRFSVAKDPPAADAHPSPEPALPPAVRPSWRRRA